MFKETEFSMGNKFEEKNSEQDSLKKDYPKRDETLPKFDVESKGDAPNKDDRPPIIEEKPFDSSNDLYSAVLERLGLKSEVKENDGGSTSDNTEDQDYSEYVEQGDDGKYYDKETGKAYESIEDWKKAQEKLLKSYETLAEREKKWGDKEWAQFKHSEENGENEAQKSAHYHKAKKHYEKSAEYKEKAAKIREKVGQKQDDSNKNS